MLAFVHATLVRGGHRGSAGREVGFSCWVMSPEPSLLQPCM